MKIGIIGGNGFIGKNLTKLLALNNEEVFVFSRKELQNQGKIKFIQMSEPNSEKLEGFDTIINLAGESVIGGRWTDERKKILSNSRVEYTNKLVSEISKLKNKPKTFLQGTAIGFYGMIDDDSKTFDESSNAGDDFLAKLCVNWEEEAKKIESQKIRLLILRTGVVLSPEEGALQQMLTPFKLFAGGHLGSGKQVMSWIHLQDMIEGIYYLIKKESASGIFNFSAPNPETNYNFSKTLGKVLSRPSIFPVPEFILKTMFGESSEVILKGQKVLPKRLLENGYNFKFPNLEEALKNLL